MNTSPPYRPEIAVILVNLGTPAAPTPSAVRRYLREFLGDRRVVEAPRWLWWLVLNFIILVFRPARVARLYDRIWTVQGSPLRVITESLAQRLGQRLADPQIRVHAAMTYGDPSLAALLEKLEAEGVGRVLVLPLYPQQSATTTGAAVDIVARYLLRTRRAPDLRIVRDYCDDPAFLDAVAASIREFQSHAGLPQRLVISFHGIPRAYVDRGDPYPGCCAASADGIAGRLGLGRDRWEMTFQSRFGREPWLTPYLDERLAAMPDEGLKSVQVVCPGFATDCLETLEEVAGQNRELFLAGGGERFAYIPALNDSTAHVDLLETLVRRNIAGW